MAEAEDALGLEAYPLVRDGSVMLYRLRARDEWFCRFARVPNRIAVERFVVGPIIIDPPLTRWVCAKAQATSASDIACRP